MLGLPSERARGTFSIYWGRPPTTRSMMWLLLLWWRIVSCADADDNMHCTTPYPAPFSLHSMCKLDRFYTGDVNTTKVTCTALCIQPHPRYPSTAPFECVDGFWEGELNCSTPWDSPNKVWALANKTLTLDKVEDPTSSPSPPLRHFCDPNSPGGVKQHSACDLALSNASSCMASCGTGVETFPTEHIFSCECVDSVCTWVGKLVCADESDGVPVWLADGVYYKALAGMMPWATAVDQAALQNYHGLRGHLATPTSEAENGIVLEVTKEVRDRSYIVPLGVDELAVPKGCWLGARNIADVVSTRHSHRHLTRPLYVAEQPRWSWVVGPLQGEAFWLGTCETCCTDEYGLNLKPDIAFTGYINRRCATLLSNGSRVLGRYTNWFPQKLQHDAYLSAPMPHVSCVVMLTENVTKSNGYWVSTPCKLVIGNYIDPSRYNFSQFAIVQFRPPTDTITDSVKFPFPVTSEPTLPTSPTGVSAHSTPSTPSTTATPLHRLTDACGDLPLCDCVKSTDLLEPAYLRYAETCYFLYNKLGGLVDCTNAPLKTLPVFNPNNPRMMKNSEIKGCASSLPKISWDSIDLSRNDLTHVPSNHFESLTWLERLTLAHNKLTVVPMLVSPYLEMLFLNNNPITYMPPFAFNQLPQLRELNLKTIESLNSDAFSTNYFFLCSFEGLTLQLPKHCTTTTITTAKQTTSTLPVTLKDSSSQAQGQTNMSIIGGGIAAAAVVVVFIIVLTLVYQSRRRVKKQGLLVGEVIHNVKTMALREFSERCSHILSLEEEETVDSSARSLTLLSVASKSLKILKRQGQFNAIGLTSEGARVLITTSSKRDTAALSKFLANAHVANLLRHNHIVQPIAVVDSEIPMMVCMEYLSGGTLKQYLKKRRPSQGSNTLTQSDLVALTNQIAAACEFLERSHLVHRSIAADHVVITDDGKTAKLSSLGEIREIYKTTEYVATAKLSEAANRMSIRWMAPETIQQGVYTRDSDCWSFGVLMWEVFCFGRTPFGTFTPQEVRDEVLGGRTLKPPMTCSERVAELMKTCWASNPSLRPSFSQIREELTLHSLPDGEQHFNHRRLASRPPGAQSLELIPSRSLTLTETIFDFHRFGIHLVSLAKTRGVRVALSGSLGRLSDNDTRTLSLLSGCDNFLHLGGTSFLSGIGNINVLQSPPQHELVGSLWNTRVPQQHRGQAAIDVALGLEFLHSHAVMLEWFNPAYCVVTENFSIKLVVAGTCTVSALGLASPQTHSEDPALEERWTWWQAPEQKKTETQLTRACNVCSFGAVLWSMYNPLPCDIQAPWHNGAKLTVDMKTLPDSIKGVVETCYAEASARPTISTVILTLTAILKGDARWQLSWSNLKEIRTLGSGQFGDVILATFSHPDADSAKFVAVKTLKKSAKERDHSEFMAEVDVMKQLRHPNLVTLIGAVTTETPMCIVLEYLSGGALDSWLEKNIGNLEQTQLLQILLEVSLGMVALSWHNIVHRDLAARNVLVGPGMHVKVSDYGLSREVGDRNYYKVQSRRPIPLRWTAPEILVSLKCTQATDVYAYGVLVSEVYCCGALPFDQLEDNALLTFLVESDQPISGYLEFKHTWASATGVREALEAPEYLRVLTTTCVSRDPTLRPTFAAVAESLTALHTTLTSSPKTWATLTLNKDGDDGYLDMEADIET
eukprot:m.157091 g.157091  ORF g.157091 m.157091 type:complete len:1661 (+) comp31039_c0_seq1:243-5225(+)